MVTDRDPSRAVQMARDVGDFLDSVRSEAVRILGPAPAPLERIKRVHRHQLLIKSSSRTTLHSMLERLQRYIEDKKIGATKVIIDVDPISLL
jgi:primosomal protein N' (replication factor Y)